MPYTNSRGYNDFPGEPPAQIEDIVIYCSLCNDPATKTIRINRKSIDGGYNDFPGEEPADPVVRTILLRPLSGGICEPCLNAITNHT